mmetsp:Transcript_17072/g.66499  ORF Transcript_17072/g.66499 Transcript_17072/m.66499 type:complete len:300 (+) Transcript_17072:20-919(+)
MERAQVKKAVVALQKHLAIKAKSADNRSLFDDAEFLYVQVMLLTVPIKARTKPISVQLPNPIYDADETEVCVFTKDPQKDFRELFQEHDIKAKVIGLSKLRANYKTFEARRKLCGSYDLFLADARVTRMLPKLLGKPFFAKKRQPVPIDLTNPKRIQEQIDDALKSTSMFLGYGPCLCVRIARSDFTTEQVTDNICQGVEFMTTKFKNGWGSVQSVHLKSQESVALPIFNQLPTAAPAPGVTPKRKRSDSLDAAATSGSPKARKTATAAPDAAVTSAKKSKKASKSATPKKSPAPKKKK